MRIGEEVITGNALVIEFIMLVAVITVFAEKAQAIVALDKTVKD